jgi:hypothetical protein
MLLTGYVEEREGPETSAHSPRAISARTVTHGTFAAKLGGACQVPAAIALRPVLHAKNGKACANACVLTGSHGDESERGENR